MKKNIFTKLIVLLALVCTLTSVPVSAWYSTAAVGYNKVPVKFIGYSCAIGVQHNVKIATNTLGSVTNTSKKKVNYTKTISMHKNISIGYSTNKTISGSINLTTGFIQSSLGSSIQQIYNFSTQFERSETDTINFSVNPKKTVKIKGTCYGDKVMVFYKYFSFWGCKEYGCATFYVPTRYSFTVK